MTALTAVVLWSTAFPARHRPEAAAAFCLVDALVPLSGIGGFEGGCNHVLKHALNFARASPPPLMARLSATGLRAPKMPCLK